MKNLKWLREQGEMMNLEEFKLFAPLTVEKSVQEFLSIYNTFAFMLEETRDLARESDEIHLAEMAKRFARGKKKQKKYGQLVSQRRALPKAS